jgi:adenine-specific DNA-methyltransferase
LLTSELGRILGKPFYQAPNCLIYNCDCLDAMRKLPTSAIDLTVTSPPYNIGKAYERNLPLEDYILWCKSWIAEIYRITQSRGALWLNLGYISIPGRAKAMPIPYLLWDQIPFFLIQEIIWNYGAGIAGKKFFSPRNEKFLWYVKNSDDYVFNLDEVRDPDVKYPNQKKNGKIKVNANGKNPSDVWQFKKVTSGRQRASKERTSHPAQFPEDLIERIVRVSSHANQLVLDPFIGSGTTAIVSLKLHRSIVGFELRADYCDIAASRIDDYLRQLQAPIQQSLFNNR